jgi:hypothetical protein
LYEETLQFLVGKVWKEVTPKVNELLKAYGITPQEVPSVTIFGQHQTQRIPGSGCQGPMTITRDLWDPGHGDRKYIHDICTQAEKDIDGIIVFCPNNLGDAKDTAWDTATARGVQDPYTDTILVRASWDSVALARIIVHEIFHDLGLWAGADSQGHDTAGIFASGGGAQGEEEKLGCRTLRALRKKGVDTGKISEKYKLDR